LTNPRRLFYEKQGSRRGSYFDQPSTFILRKTRFSKRFLFWPTLDVYFTKNKVLPLRLLVADKRWGRFLF